MDNTTPPIIDTNATPADPGFTPDPNAGTFVAAPAEKKHTNVLAIILIILLVASCGFAGYEFYLNTQHASEIKTLKSKNESLSTQVTDLQAQLDAIKDIANNTTNTTTSNTTEGDMVYVEEGVLYAKNLGLKFTIPEELKSLAYTYTDASLDITASTIAGLDLTDEKLVNPGPTESLTEGSAFGTGSLKIQEGEKIYVHPQSVNFVTEEDKKVETESNDLIQKMLTENASPIEE